MGHASASHSHKRKHLKFGDHYRMDAIDGTGPSVLSSLPKEKEPERVTPVQTLTEPGYRHYLSTLAIIPSYKAKYAIQDEKGLTLLSSKADFIYFDNREKACAVQIELMKRFGLRTEVTYGPAHRQCGEVVSRMIPLPQPVKQNEQVQESSTAESHS